MQKNNHLAQKWYDLASEDLKVAQLVLTNGLYLQAAFHAQQCLEKSLKGLLVLEGIEPPYTHDLVRLYRELRSILGHRDDDATKNEKDLAELNPYYILSRYPSFKLNVSKGLTKIKIEKILKYTLEVLLWLELKLKSEK